MINIVCVLRSGGVYDTSYVRALARGVQENLRLPYRFVCLSDLQFKFPGVEVIPLKYNWPGWWSVVEAWNPTFGNSDQNTLYIDLDTLVVGSLDDIVGYDGDLCVLRDFYRTEHPANGVMYYSPRVLKPFWKAFKKNPTYWMAEGGKMIPPHFGNMIFWRENLLETPYEYWQDIFPGQIVSYKVHCRQGLIGKIPAGARLICSHGIPKPPEIKDSRYRHLWLKYSRE
jgi:hypothetical protein